MRPALWLLAVVVLVGCRAEDVTVEQPVGTILYVYTEVPEGLEIAEEWARVLGGRAVHSVNPATADLRVMFGSGQTFPEDDLVVATYDKATRSVLLRDRYRTESPAFQRRAVRHEIGHFFGLGHRGVCPATMNAHLECQVDFIDEHAKRHARWPVPIFGFLPVR